ncbi:S9 family peptidase [Sulfobacillus sp. DSM 109850]|uniref:S9 family peptidase n=1 Tax=Sulfobacillus harzensis TaxID=2729629 RepID=A0A7Y0L1E1_9FIRM|nr:S9 family peptidase [Sulfobacillus harzensis]
MGFDLHDLDRIVSLTHPVIHPLDAFVVMVYKRVANDKKSYESRLLVAGPGTPARFLTGGPKDAHPAFSADGRFLWFIRSQDDRGQRLMRLPWEGGEAEPVGPKFWDLAMVKPIPGGDGVLVLARAPEPPPEEPQWPRHYQRWQWQYDGQRYFPDHPISLWHVDGQGQTTRLEESVYDIASVSISPDGRFVVYDRITDETAAAVPRSDIYRLNLTASASPERMTDGPKSWRAPTVLGDGRIVALASGQDFGPATIEELYEVAPTNRRLPLPPDLEVGESISSDTRFGPEPIRPLAVGTSGVAIAATQQGQTHVWIVDGVQAEPLGVPAPVAAQYAANGSRVVVIGGSLTALDEAYWCENGIAQPITEVNHWAREKITPTEIISITRPDGMAIPAYVTGMEERQPRPLILYVHGGPHGAYGENVRYDTQVMVQNGYVVAQVNPRGSMGYGQAFRNAVRSDWGG